MKKYTKLMGILLALVMLVALMPMTALADSTPPTPTPDGSGTIVGPVPYPPNTDPTTDKTKVEVEKIAHGLDKAKKYTFNFEYYQIEDEHGTKPIEGGVKGNFSIIVEWNANYNEHSGRFTINDLPKNIWLAIEEIDPVIPEGYRLFAPDMVTVYTESSDNKRDIYNIYEERNNDCDVVISKAVEGNNANANDEFKFEVTFYMPKYVNRNPEMSSVRNAAPVRAPGAGNDIGIYKRFADGSTYAFGPGELTYEDNVSYEGLKEATLRFTLKHGESLSIIGLAVKNRPITVNELDSKGYLTTVNGMIGTQWKEEEPVADTIRVNFINTKESLPLSESLSVEKRWSDGNEKHMRENVTVQLYRNGEPYSFTMFGRVIDDGRAELNASNGWQHTWRGLDTGYKWTVAELNVPKGYVSTVNYYGGSAIITNTAVSAGLPQTGDAQMPYIGAGLVLAAMAIVVIIAGKKRN